MKKIYVKRVAVIKNVELLVILLIRRYSKLGEMRHL